MSLNFIMKQKLFIFIFLYLFHAIISDPIISASINVEEISNQKCFSSQNDQSNQKTSIYQIINNSTSNTIFIQYKSLSSFIVSDSIKDESSIIYKNMENMGSYYLNMDTAKNNYYISISKNDNDFQICFVSFSQKGNNFKLNDKENTNIKKASYDLITNANLTYYISNCDLKQNKIFYTLRFEQSLLNKINTPKMQLSITFINSQRKNELFTIDKYYLQDKYFYIPFYIPKLNYTEKFTEIIICMNILFKQPLLKDEIFKFDLELIDSQEITCEFNLNLLQKDNTKIKNEYPKVYFINLQRNIFEYDRDILLLKHDSENKYIKPFLTTNININNENSFFIQKDLIDLNQKSLTKNQNNLNNRNNAMYLLVLILDESINEIREGQNDNAFISFKFYGGYHDLMHYEEEISVTKFFNEEKNKILIKMPNCRSQYFINYFNQIDQNKNDERILDIESSIGHMDLFYMNQIKGNNLDEYFNNLKEKCIHKFENSLLSGNFGTLEISCPDNKPVISYIYAHRKNMKEDYINFMNQKSLLYIEYNTQYSFKFNDKEKENDFNFRIKLLRTNILNEEYKIEITYNNQNFVLDKENLIQAFQYSKNTDSNILVRINSNNVVNTNDNTKGNKGVILEVFKGIDILNENILYIEDETEKGDLSSNKMILFIYSKKEINSAFNKIQLLNENNAQAKINICIRSGKGVYPYISKPLCTEENEYIIIEPGQSLNLTYNNPYTDGRFDEPFYVSLISDNDIKFSYGYERQIKLEQNIYENLNHNGKKILKISSQKHDKKSMYYQINVCENKNSKFYYNINNSGKTLIKNDIYQEYSLEDLSSYLITFEGDGEQVAKFKYFYGSEDLLNKIEKFSKNINISKSGDEKRLLISFQTPFVQQIDIKIIFALGFEEKYKDVCSFETFCKNNFDSGKLKLYTKRALAKDNKATIHLTEEELKEILNVNVDIYIIAKSIETNLEIFYNVKSITNFNLNQLDSNLQINDGDKNYICINCEGNDELDEKDEDIEKIENKKDNKEKEDEEDEDEDEEEEDDEKEKNTNKAEVKTNDIKQPEINQNPINVINNNENSNKNNENSKNINEGINNKDDNENNNKENDENNENNNNVNIINNGNNLNENNGNENKGNENNDNENNGNINNGNENNNNENNNNENNNNENDNNENNNNENNNNNMNDNENNNNDNNNIGKINEANENNNNEENNENRQNPRSGEDNDNRNDFLGRGNNFGQNNNKANDGPKNREDEKDGDIDNDKDNNNDHDHDQDNEQGFDNNQNNDNFNNHNHNNNSTNNSETINEIEINNQNQLNNGMRNDINSLNNITKIENNDIKINNNQTRISGDNNTTPFQNNLSGEAIAPKQKSRKFLYIMIIIIIALIIYYIRNQWCNNSENVSYSKISKYSYYDF